MCITGKVHFGLLYLPLTLACVSVFAFVVDYGLPTLNSTFYMLAIVGGLCQIAVIFIWIHLFSSRNCAVSIMYSRTNPHRRYSSA